MKKILLFLVLNIALFSFSQSTERYSSGENFGPVPSDFYKLKFEVKDFQITNENVDLLKNIDLKSLFLNGYENQDTEIYVEEIQKTIIIYSRVKSEELMELYYNHTTNFVPLYKM